MDGNGWKLEYMGEIDPVDDTIHVSTKFKWYLMVVVWTTLVMLFLYLLLRSITSWTRIDEIDSTSNSDTRSTPENKKKRE